MALPDELIADVLAYLHADKESLAQCALSHSALRASAQSLLFRKLSIQIHPRAWIELALPQIERHLLTVRVLGIPNLESAVDDEDLDWTNLLAQIAAMCPNITEIVCSILEDKCTANGLQSFHHAFPALVSLALECPTFESSAGCLGLLSMFPHLTYLGISLPTVLSGDSCIIDYETASLPSLHTTSLSLLSEKWSMPHAVPLLPCLASPDLSSLAVDVSFHTADTVYEVLVARARSLISLVLDLTSYYNDSAYLCMLGYTHNNPPPLQLYHWLPSDNRIEELSLEVDSCERLATFMFNMDLPNLRILRVIVYNWGAGSEVAEVPDILEALGSSASGLLLVTLQATLGPHDTWAENVLLRMFASASRRGILCASITVED